MSSKDEIQSVRSELGIPDSAQKVIILSQAAHLDWDWLNVNGYLATGDSSQYPFCTSQFVSVPPIHSSCPATPHSGSPQPTNYIFCAALGLLQNNPGYFYSICEMGFLDQFFSVAAMNNTQRLRIVGGGITSPDNLLPHGEAFLRNFLVGISWLKEQGLEWTRTVWMPDDFGHDSQLPVMLESMGALGVGFSRIPGNIQQGNNENQPGNNSAATILLGFGNASDTGGVDFVWLANDGSQSVAYWMPAGYFQGDNIDDGPDTTTFNSPKDLNTNTQSLTIQKPPPSVESQHIQSYINTNGPISTTEYIYLHISNDFVMPKPDLCQWVDDWNQNSGSSVQAVVGTFVHYNELVRQAEQANPGTLKKRSWHGSDTGQGGVFPFQPRPYWMGFYASRAALKILHYNSTRALLGAETMGIFSDLLNRKPLGPITQRVKDLHYVWSLLVPSTHHDYITGTAVDCVTDREQEPRLKCSFNTAISQRSKAISEIAGKMSVGQNSVAVFNQLGFANSGLVELNITPAIARQLGLDPNPNVQRAAGGADAPYLVYGDAPSMGYKSIPVAGLSVPGTLSSSSSGGSIVLRNDFLSATIGSDGWISGIADIKGGIQNILSGSGNQLSFFYDNGNIYRFGFECSGGSSWSELAPTVSVVNPPKLIETGPLRCTVWTKIKVENQGVPSINNHYCIEYTLEVNSPYLQVQVTGAAPSGVSVFTNIPFTQSIDTIQHGTPYHWDTKQPWKWGGKFPIVEATHNLVVAQNGGKPQGAVYHGSIPAWGGDGQTLVGCLVRNADTNGCEGKGASGTDNATHARSFAIRVPAGIEDLSQVTNLAEALAYNTPMQGIALATQPGSLPLSASLCSIESGNAIVTAAKAGTYCPENLILRIYQPSNQKENIAVRLNASFIANPTAESVTSLETAMDNPISVTGSNGLWSFAAARAVTTLSIGKGSVVCPTGPTFPTGATCPSGSTYVTGATCIAGTTYPTGAAAMEEAGPAFPKD